MFLEAWWGIEGREADKRAAAVVWAVHTSVPGDGRRGLRELAGG